MPSRSAPRGLVSLLLVALLTGPAFAGERYELDAGREAALVGAGLVVGVGALEVTGGQATLTPEQIAARNPAQVNGFDRIATGKWSETAGTVTDVLAVGLTVSPALLYTQTGAGMDAGELSVMWGETLLLQQATVSLLKGLFCRARPYVYNDDPRIPPELGRSARAVRSFPSGHTATAFAGATFLSTVFARINPDDPARYWVTGTSLTLAAITGWLRVEAGMHYPTDVLAGALVGALIGWGVPRLHEIDPAGGDKAGPPPGLVFGFAF